MENVKNYSVWIISAVLLVFSVIFFFSAQAFSDQGSYVEVKGLSEKIVKADVAIWSLNFDVKSNNIDSLYADIEKNTLAIKSFLTEKGFEVAEINVAPVNIYQDTYKDALFRYNANTQLSDYSKKVDLVRSASKESLALVKKGVTLNQNSIEFQFSDINSIKPEMLAEAWQLSLRKRGEAGAYEKVKDKTRGKPREELKEIKMWKAADYVGLAEKLAKMRVG